MRGLEPPDYEAIVSHMCEEFHCLPWQAEEQLEHNPQIVFDILETREFIRVKHAIENAKSETDVPKGRMADLVADLIVEAIREGQGLSG